VFELTVTDTASPGQTSTDTVQVTVNAKTGYTYDGDAKAIIDTNCLSCHGPGGQRSVTPFTNYTQVMARINDPDLDVADTIAGRISSTGAGKMPKPPATAWTDADKTILLDWIGGGAPEN